MVNVVAWAPGGVNPSFSQSNFTSRKAFRRPSKVSFRLANKRESGLRSESLQYRNIAFRNSKLNGTTLCLRPLPSRVTSRILEVDLTHSQAECFCDATANVQQEQDEQMQAAVTCALGLPLHQEPDFAAR